MMMFSKKSKIKHFKKSIKNKSIFVLKNIITGPQNIVRITTKSPGMNVSHRVDVARYPIFSPAPNIRKVTCFQKMIFQLDIVYKSLKDRLGRPPLNNFPTYSWSIQERERKPEVNPTSELRA